MTDDERKAHEVYMSLLLRNKQVIWRLCWNYAHGDNERFHDLLQEVFLVLWRNFSSLRPESTPEQEGVWVWLTARRVLSNMHRQRQIDGLGLAEVASYLYDDSRDTTHEQVEDILSTLPQDERKLMRRLMEGYNFVEIAEMLDLKPNTVRKRYARIVAKLRKKINNNEQRPF